MAASSSSPSLFSLLPDELKLHCLAQLPYEDLIKCTYVCRDWKRLAQDNLLWIQLFRKAQPSVSISPAEYQLSHQYWMQRLLSPPVRLRVLVVDQASPQVLGVCRYVLEAPSLATLAQVKGAVLQFGRRRSNCHWKELDDPKLLQSGSCEGESEGELRPIDESAYYHDQNRQVERWNYNTDPDTSPIAIQRLSWEQIGTTSASDTATQCFAAGYFYSGEISGERTTKVKDPWDQENYGTFRYWELARWTWCKMGKHMPTDAIPRVPRLQEGIPVRRLTRQVLLIQKSYG